MKKIISSRSISQVAIATLITTLAMAGVVLAATTIGSNITTAGTTTLATTTIAINGTRALSVTNSSNTPIFEVDTTNSRASTTSIIVPQANAVTPRFNASSTAVSIGDGSPIAKLLFGTCVVDVPSTTASSSSITTCSATGVTSSDRVFITPITTSTIIMQSASSTTDSIQVEVWNTGMSGTVDPDASTWQWMAIR